MLKLKISPHVHSSHLTAKMMFWVLVAMLPALGVKLYYFGYGVLIQLLLAVCFAVFLEAVALKMRKKPIWFHLTDGSAILTATILALSIPDYAPYWIILIGIFCAIVIGKQVYGGLGQNVFNPAMVGYVVLLVAFPVQMTSWLPTVTILDDAPTWQDSYSLIFTGLTSDGFTLLQLINTIDGIGQATPLDSIKTGLTQHNSLWHLEQLPIFASTNGGLFLGIGWWQLNMAFLCGGLLLLWQKVIHWHVPVAFLGTLCFFSALAWWIVPDQNLSPLWHLFSGASMFGAFFIATDPVSASITPKGKIILGILLGGLVFIIRQFGGYPDGVAFAVLLGNIGVPLIDHYSQPHVYGESKHD